MFPVINCFQGSSHFYETYVETEFCSQPKTTTKNWDDEIVDVMSFLYDLSKKQNDCSIDDSSIDDSLSFLCKELQTKLRERKYGICDKILNRIEVDKFNTYILVGILAATLNWAHKLNNRQNFLCSVKENIYKKYDSEEAVSIIISLE